MATRRSRLLVGIGVATTIVPTAILYLGFNMLFVVPPVIGFLVTWLAESPRVSSKTEVLCVVLIVITWGGTFALSAYSIYSMGPGPPVEFVVPVGFRGTIQIIRDRENGEDLKFEHGCYVFVIPSTGLVRVKKAYPFHRWHHESCRDADGHLRHLESKEVTAGSRRIGPATIESNPAFDGTVYRWKVQ